MDRKTAEAIRDAIINIRSSVSDDVALENKVLYPQWRAFVEYRVNERIIYKNVMYRVLIAHLSQNDWTPDISPSIFTKVLIPDPDIIPEWEQPDSTNAYSIGDKVSHNERIWISTIDNNVWEPGVYGWDPFNES